MIDIYRDIVLLGGTEFDGVPGVPLHRTPSGLGVHFANKGGPEAPESSYSTPPRGPREDINLDTIPMGTQAIRFDPECPSLSIRRTLIHKFRKATAEDSFNGKCRRAGLSFERHRARADAARGRVR
jgi:hypothetical protein